MRRAELLILTAVMGCAPAAAVHEATAPAQPATTTPADSGAKSAHDRLPPLLSDLGLDPVQEKAIVAVRVRLEEQALPFVAACRELGRAYAQASRLCRTDLPSIESQSSWVVTAGEGMRGPVLDAVNSVHAILRPEQRRALSDRLLGASKDSREGKKDRARTRSLGDVLDVSWGQMVVLLARAVTLREAFEERVGTMRRDYEHAVVHFADDEFDARREPVAEADVFTVSTKFVRDGFRTLLPELEPKQCRALGDFLDAKLDEAEAADRRAD